MTTSEKFCLKFNNFQENMNAVFKSLRYDTGLSDVTLVCEDGQRVMVNRIILESASPVFKNLFRGEKHADTIVYMTGVKTEDMRFWYNGEANINQDNLDSFLKIVKELKVKDLSEAGQGVSGEEENLSPRKPEETKVSMKFDNLTKNAIHNIIQNMPMLNRFLPKIDPNPAFSKRSIISQTNNVIASCSALDRMDGGNKFEITWSSPPLKISIKSETKNVANDLSIFDKLVSEITATVPKQRFFGDFQDLDAQIETIMGRGENVSKKLGQTMFIAYVCRVCGKKVKKIKLRTKSK